MQLSSGDLLKDLQKWQKMYILSINALSYSQNTIELYNRTINFFIEYMREFQEEILINNIEHMHFINFLSFLDKKAKLDKTIKNKLNLSKSTKQTYLKGIRNFFIYISDNNDEGHTYERFFRKLKIADSSRAEEKIRYLSEDKVQKLLIYLERLLKKKTYNSYRDSLLIKLLLHSALRISEALNVTLADITSDQDDNEILVIKVLGKGGKIQFARIVKTHIQAELDYFSNTLGIDLDENIFVTKSGKKLLRENAYVIVSNHYKRAGFFQTGLHILRHTLAMRLTENDTDILVIKETLRHSSYNSTTVYAKASSKRVSGGLKSLL
ncbi:tyrosine-type recombinase/integrase [Sulfurimonas sp.]|uniref:tyrosine-type recombinase/integrase n=1 Tax=Sulfurimonas sp. TaxID=2022749 RepID=UPI0019DC9D78|nr:tyrosine-type recombinase/integrase [Sulfurimonas sp.]MBE0515526.1 tyrosine-type recombinase/integrase [Sulfurimonas sp.]